MIIRISVLHREAIKTPVVLDACRIKRCENLYSGDETLIRSAASLAICKVLEQKAHLRGLFETHCFAFL